MTTSFDHRRFLDSSFEIEPPKPLSKPPSGGMRFIAKAKEAAR